MEFGKCNQSIEEAIRSNLFKHHSNKNTPVQSARQRNLYPITETTLTQGLESGNIETDKKIS
jgi:hypothetical protein